MVRRIAMVMATLCLISPAVLGHAESPEMERGGITALEDRLKTGLRVQAPRDVKFIEAVASKVRDGRLPEKLVDSTYLWAVRRGKKYPFPAFEHVIRLQAGKLGVPLE